MKNFEKVIEKIKGYFLLTGFTAIKYVFPDNLLEKYNDIECLKYLEEENYILITSKALGYYEFELKSYFIDNVEYL